ncbi:DUF2637 domain-containing protein [Streptomyces sp. NPDC001549]|uniref:DUF2637 domain-containing protein n=1 Tax=Streptomyces sp. NPDC001549 TaxID=3364586 RepID=UPI0036A796C2
MNRVQIRSSERALSVGTWLIVGGAMLYSVLTVTPLMAAHTPAEWQWTAPILPLVVDAAVVIVVRLDSVLARLSGHGGAWPVALRWMTGTMTLALNIGVSALAGDLVGVAVHSVAPLLLIVTAEAGLAYRRALTTAILAVEARKRAEQDVRERAAAEREENRLRAAREQRDHEARLAREEADRQDRIRREESERAEAADRAEREAAERREHEREQAEAERERLERQAAQQRELEAQEQAERERRERVREQERMERERAALLAAGPPPAKLPEEQARATVAAAFAAGVPVRVAAELSGWSVGWASARYQEHRDGNAATAPALGR